MKNNTLKKLEKIYTEIKRDCNYNKAREMVNAVIEYEDYCGYNLNIENCDIYLGDDDMAQAWFFDEGGYNAQRGEHSISDIAIMLEGLTDCDDQYGFYCLNVYGYLHFIDYIQALDEIIEAYCINATEEINNKLIEIYEQ